MIEREAKTYKEIYDTVQEIKDSVRVDYLDIQRLAVDVFGLCVNLGIKAFGQELDKDIDVIIVRDDDTDRLRIIVNVNNEPSMDKARYLLAKGLGAIALGLVGNYLAFKRIDESYNPLPISSDIFATALLMDEDKVKNCIYEGRSSVEELSEAFQVPLFCAAKRLMYLDK